MKKLLLFATITFASCQSKLPANIQSAVDNVKFYDKANYQTDSLFSNLTQAQIDKLTEDSLGTLVAFYDVAEMERKSSKAKLEELLKYSPEYSSYPQIEDLDSERYKGSTLKQYENYTYIKDLYHSKIFPTLYDKPTYSN